MSTVLKYISIRQHCPHLHTHTHTHMCVCVSIQDCPHLLFPLHSHFYYVLSHSLALAPLTPPPPPPTPVAHNPNRDDAPVDMDLLVSILLQYQNGLITEDEEQELTHELESIEGLLAKKRISQDERDALAWRAAHVECCPTCRRCGLLPQEVLV